MAIIVSNQPTPAPIDLAATEFTFSVGPQNFTVPIVPEPDALKNQTIEVSLAASTTAPAAELNKSPFMSVEIVANTPLGTLPHRNDLSVSNLIAGKLDVPAHCVTVDAERNVTVTEGFITNVARALITAAGDPHKVSFDDLPVEIAAGTPLGKALS